MRGSVRLRNAVVCGAVITVLVSLSGCGTKVPDRRADVDRLSAQLGSMPGVQGAHAAYANHWAEGVVMFNIHVDASDSLTADELAALVDTYLRNVASGRYRDYHTELNIRHGWNVFAVDSSDRPIANATQILDQARDWIALRTMLPGATVALRATISHPVAHLTPREIGSSNLADIELAAGSHSEDIAGAVSTIGAHFPYLAMLNWTVSAARAEDRIAFTGRFPTPAELELWRQLTSDQTIAHTDSMQINGPATPPVWLSEATTGTDAVDVALALATRHLPLTATLPAPVLYTASSQLSGHIGGYGVSRGPVAITIGGCTRRDLAVYQPSAGEQALIHRYETCRR
ncbi:hypothetical protein [Mycolicibacterium llatzerense]|uniref:hypothetical protein n=1 Tax=Mycolicibacterium llatzerense TaxID=280871 RepID=UPI0021B696A0|nr:hypothetical protein [Mycolicibacterium llatzerense]MCT7365023.1 hypothetical protein [Mycolicibacterium llatzerense]